MLVVGVIAAATIVIALLVLAFGVAAYRKGYRRGVEDGATVVMVCAPACPNEDRWLD